MSETEEDILGEVSEAHNSQYEIHMWTAESWHYDADFHLMTSTTYFIYSTSLYLPRAW